METCKSNEISCVLFENPEYYVIIIKIYSTCTFSYNINKLYYVHKLQLKWNVLFPLIKAGVIM